MTTNQLSRALDVNPLRLRRSSYLARPHSVLIQRKMNGRSLSEVFIGLKVELLSHCIY